MDWQDELDIQREGDNAAKSMIKDTGASSKAVRSMTRASIVQVYHVHVRYMDLAPGFEKAWIKGWRKGYGVPGSY